MMKLKGIYKKLLDIKEPTLLLVLNNADQWFKYRVLYPDGRCMFMRVDHYNHHGLEPFGSYYQVHLNESCFSEETSSLYDSLEAMQNYDWNHVTIVNLGAV